MGAAVLSMAACASCAMPNSQIPILDVPPEGYSLAASFREMVPHLPGMLEVEEHTGVFDGHLRRSVTWRVTDCENGQQVSGLIFSDIDSVASLDLLTNVERQRAIWLSSGDGPSVAEVATFLQSLGSAVTMSEDGQFRERCELRGTGQLGGILN